MIFLALLLTVVGGAAVGTLLQRRSPARMTTARAALAGAVLGPVFIGIAVAGIGVVAVALVIARAVLVTGRFQHATWLSVIGATVIMLLQIGRGIWDGTATTYRALVRGWLVSFLVLLLILGTSALVVGSDIDPWQ